MLNDLGEVVMDKKRARRAYACSWFLLDLPASLPYIFLSRFLPLSVPIGVFIMFDCLKILRLPRAFRYMYRCAVFVAVHTKLGRSAKGFE